ncbi:large ribosomal subunit protein mL43 [Onthophagus taurus]|uniref:large ribosomal subunit protein mL43 n=1 Tax=Onthophagus taurus TaxID=166361 RepID=UPI000C20DFAD|nr:39S ribosomal protein L43, mitochondrial [Onthophagus taurus]
MSNTHLFLKSGFLTTPGYNGVGRYVCQLQRVVLKFCKNNGSSRGMRDFVEKGLINFAESNPGVVVYLKPRRHRSPVIIAEYLNGDKQHISCRNYTEEEVLKWLNLLRTQSGNHEGFRLRKMWHTDHPSIQGPWTPFTFREEGLNLVKFPQENLSVPLNEPKSATQQLLEAFKRQQKDVCDLEKQRGE